MSVSRTVLAIIMAILLLLPQAVQGQEAVSLDLSSTDKTVSASSINGFQGANIDVGGVSQAITPDHLLTPAEYVALSQVLATGSQSLLLSAQGNAVGGSFNIGHSDISHLIIPQGVDAIYDAAILSNLGISGNLNNAGNLYAISSNPEITIANIAANNIYNQIGGLLTTVLPTNGISGYSNLVNSLSLNLMALNNIINAGTISSAGNLTASAGGTITNALPVGINGAGPIMQAMNNLNLITNNVVNSGLINANLGNINIASQIVQDMRINNTGGTIQALNGLINVRDDSFLAKSHLGIWGGDLLSKELNLFSGDGNVYVDVGQITGPVNISAGAAWIFSSTDTLRLGNINLTGDPTFYNAGGDVVIDRDLIFPGQHLAIVAALDIKTAVQGDGSPATINISTSSSTGNAGDIIMIAGALLLPNKTHSIGPGDPIDPDINLSIFGASVLGGGKIDLTAGPDLNAPRVAVGSISAQGNCAGCNGGNVTFIAYKTDAGLVGVAVPDLIPIESGKINLASNASISSGGGGNGTNGNVNFLAAGIADGSDLIANVINVGNINTTGGTGTGGDILAINATPEDGYSIVNSTFGPGTYFLENGIGGKVDTTKLTGAAVAGLAHFSFGSLSAPGRSIVLNNKFGTIATGAITNNGVNSSGGSVSITYSSDQAFVLGASSNNGVNGNITANAGTSGNGGSIVISNLDTGGNINITSAANLSVNASVNGGNGGSIMLLAGQADSVNPDSVLPASTGGINLPSQSGSSAIISANAGGTGNYNGGSIYLRGKFVNAASGGKLQLSANGSSSGNGGTIQIHSYAPVNIGTDNGEISLSATGGAPGGIASGGIIRISGTALNIESQAIDVRALGDWGSGGKVELISNHSNAFLIGGTNGCTNCLVGTLNATGAVLGGDGGQILITNKGVSGIGGITLTDWNLLNVLPGDNSGGGKGGKLWLDAVSTLTIPTGSFSVSASGAPGFSSNMDGGIIYLSGNQLVVSGAAGSVNLSANAINGGNGGSITVKNNQSRIYIGSDAGTPQSVFNLSATGGSINSLSGNGGNITVEGLSVRADASVNGAINVSALGAGNGGSISITGHDASNIFVAGSTDSNCINCSRGVLNASAGPGGGNGGSIILSNDTGLTVNMKDGSNNDNLKVNPVNNGNGGYLKFASPTTGNLTVVGDIIVNGLGTGSGGTVILQSGIMTQAFVINGGGACTRCVRGRIEANGGATSGSGGTVDISVSGSGNITWNTLSDISFSPGVTGGHGGKLYLTSTGGGFFLPNNAIISANASGSGDFNGGIISINGPVALGNTLTFNANAIGNGNGGSISVINTGYNIGTQAGQLRLSAIGQNAVINIVQSSNMTINTDGIIAGPINAAGKGAEILINTTSFTLTVNGTLSADAAAGFAGDGGEITIYANRLIVNQLSGAGGSFTANAGSSGNGGTINLFLESSTEFVVGGSTTNSIFGGLSANAGTNSGNGGVIAIEKAGDIKIVSPDSITVNSSAGGGNGGTIAFSSTNGTITIGDGTLNASAGGSGVRNGGTISLDADYIVIDGNGVLNLLANASGTGNGGSVVVYSRESDSNLVIGNVSGQVGGQIAISATGGSTNSLSGNGGGIGIFYNGNVSIDGDAVNVMPQGNGNGGTIVISNLGSGDGANLSGTLNASGNGASGNGGSISLDTGMDGNLNISANLLANGSGTGNGGAVNILSKSDIIVNVVSGPGQISLNGNVSVAAGDGSLEKMGIINFGEPWGLTVEGPGTLTGRIQAVSLIYPINIDVGGSLTAGMIVSFTVPSENIIEFNTVIGPFLAALLNIPFNPVPLEAPITLSAPDKITIPVDGIIAAINSGINLESQHIHNDGRVITFNALGETQTTDINISTPTGNLLLSGSGNYQGLLTPNTISVTAPNLTLAGSFVLDSFNGQVFLNGLNVGSVYTVNGSFLPFIPGLLTNTSNLVSNNVQGDVLSNRNKEDAATKEFVRVMGEHNKDLVVFTTASQVFMGSVDGGDYEAIGAPGTVISHEQNTVVLHRGRLALDSGKNTTNVNTRVGVVSVAAGATVIVDDHPGKPVRVLAIGGSGDAPITVSRSGEEELVTLRPGEEAILGDTDLAAEDLIPADGIDRVLVTGGISVRSKKSVKTQFALGELMQKELMVAGHSVRIGGGKGTRVASSLAKAVDASKMGNTVKQEGAVHLLRADTAQMDNSALEHGQWKPDVAQPVFMLAGMDTLFRHSVNGGLEIRSGSLFLNVPDKTVCNTKVGQVHLAKNALAMVEAKEGCMRVKACSGPGAVTVMAGGKKIDLMPGEEVFIADHNPSKTETTPADGIGRRQVKSIKLQDGKIAVLSEFSIASMIGTREEMAMIRQPITPEHKHVRDVLMKTAVILQYLTNKHGQYSSKPKETAIILPEEQGKRISQAN
jgi:hypothetical protein